MESYSSFQQSISKPSYRPSQALVDIRYIGEENIYDCINENARVVIAKLGRHDFRGRPPVMLETRPIHTFIDGNKYQGQWNPATNKFEGQGIFVWSNDGSIYEGYYRNGMRNGRGRYIYYNGDVYEGAWRDDKRHGTGKWI